MKELLNLQAIIHASKAALILFVGATLVLWSWNNTLPALFGLPSIHFKESIGLILLALSISFIFRQGRHPILKHDESK
ncbi:MAG: hypothetical protein ACE5EH_05325 [Gammaproteobacteria bacterium]